MNCPKCENEMAESLVSVGDYACLNCPYATFDFISGLYD